MKTIQRSTPPGRQFFLKKELYLIFGVLAILALLPIVLPYYALGTEIILFALAAVAFDLCLGYTGVMMFCQASFFGTGVYVTALTLIHSGVILWLVGLLAVRQLFSVTDSCL